MPLFTSSREKRLWIWALLVVAAIYSTLFAGQPFATLLGSQDVQAVIFILVMVLVGTTVIVHALNKKTSKIEITILLGMVAVYGMLFLRLGLSERSHLMEYSILAIFIHKAVTERVNQGKPISRPAILSFGLTFLIGVLDECIQIILPNRVFDPVDILFNGIAVTMAIGSIVVITWARKRVVKNRMKGNK